jgi:hypothetical protein
MSRSGPVTLNRYICVTWSIEIPLKNARAPLAVSPWTKNAV